MLALLEHGPELQIFDFYLTQRTDTLNTY
jgi:hypothetical protein